MPIETLERAVRMADELDLDGDDVLELQQDIAAANSTKTEFVTYYCC